MTIHILESGQATADAAASAFRFEIIGDKSVLRLEGGAMRGLQSGRLTLSLDGAPQTVDEGELAALPDTAANVGGVYAALRDGIRGGASHVADFDHAVALTRLVTDLFDASAAGTRKVAADWPSR